MWSIAIRSIQTTTLACSPLQSTSAETFNQTRPISDQAVQSGHHVTSPHDGEIKSLFPIICWCLNHCIPQEIKCRGCIYLTSWACAHKQSIQLSSVTVPSALLTSQPWYQLLWQELPIPLLALLLNTCVYRFFWQNMLVFAIQKHSLVSTVWLPMYSNEETKHKLVQYSSKNSVATTNKWLPH